MIVKANELRIGNYFTFAILYTVKVTGIKKHDIIDPKKGTWQNTVWFKGDGASGNDRIEALMPIRIDEKWLRKFEFKKHEFYSEDCPIFEMDDILFDLKTFTVSLLADDPFCVHVVKQKIYYVHQLQNLYYALKEKIL